MVTPRTLKALYGGSFKTTEKKGGLASGAGGVFGAAEGGKGVWPADGCVGLLGPSGACRGRGAPLAACACSVRASPAPCMPARLHARAPRAVHACTRSLPLRPWCWGCSGPPHPNRGPPQPNKGSTAPPVGCVAEWLTEWWSPV